MRILDTPAHCGPSITTSNKYPIDNTHTRPHLLDVIALLKKHHTPSPITRCQVVACEIKLKGRQQVR